MQPQLAHKRFTWAMLSQRLHVSLKQVCKQISFNIANKEWSNNLQPRWTKMTGAFPFHRYQQRSLVIFSHHGTLSVHVIGQSCFFSLTMMFSLCLYLQTLSQIKSTLSFHYRLYYLSNFFIYFHASNTLNVSISWYLPNWLLIDGIEVTSLPLLLCIDKNLGIWYRSRNRWLRFNILGYVELL